MDNNKKTYKKMNKLNIKITVLLFILFQLNKISPVHLALYKLKENIFEKENNISEEERKARKKFLYSAALMATGAVVYANRESIGNFFKNNTRLKDIFFSTKNEIPKKQSNEDFKSFLCAYLFGAGSGIFLLSPIIFLIDANYNNSNDSYYENLYYKSIENIIQLNNLYKASIENNIQLNNLYIKLLIQHNQLYNEKIILLSQNNQLKNQNEQLNSDLTQITSNNHRATILSQRY